MDGAGGDQELHLLEGERRVELRSPPLGAADRRNAVQGYRHTRSCVWSRGQQTYATDSEHVPAAMAGTDGK